MSDVINVLPDSIANQIAAGEVIQRPASVVKELVENAIDAGADKISVSVKDSGSTFIKVSDNGKGMSHTDARMAFERHATSKIRDTADLFRLHTMGFRGEALASIAAVAAVELHTRQADAEFGTFIEIAASNIVRHEPTACAAGTTFVVKNLFFNVPARRKFLKSPDNELRHIIYEFQRIALANPQVELSLYSNSGAVYELQPSNLKQRITAIFGKKTKNYASQLISVGTQTDIVKISGFVGSPQSAVRNATQFFFANGRFMRHPYFNKAVQMAYDNMLQPNTQPIYFINIEVNPANIDVNVHPTKTEIKFEDEKEIFSILMACVKESLGKFNFVPSLDFDTESSIAIPAYSADNRPDMPKMRLDSSYNPFASQHRAADNSRQSLSHWETLYDSPQRTASTSHTPVSANIPIDIAASDAEPTAANNSFIYKDKYIVTSVKSGLMIIERRLALERIMYEKIILQLQQGQKATQALLFPDTVEFSADEAIIFEKILPDIEAIGFDVEKISANSYSIRGVPSVVTETATADRLLKDIVADVVDESDVGREIYEKIALRTAKAYAKSMQNSNEYETEYIISSLLQCQTPNFSPDGSKIIIVLSDEDIWGSGS